MIDIKKIIESQPVPTGFPDDLKNELQSFESFCNPELTPLTETDANFELSPERIGRFTGSSNTKLMSCKSRAKGKSWDNVVWITDLGDTALRYITEKAIERIIKQQVETFDNKYVRWGKHYEDEGKYFITNNFGGQIKECDFSKFFINAGATPDGYFDEGVLKIDEKTILTFSDKKKYVFELKCPETVWSSYKLGLYGIDESHDYFWQLQSEMLSLKTDKFIFCYYDPRFPDDMKVKFHIGYLSPVHVNALKARIIIGERLIKKIIDSKLTCNVFDELPNAVIDIPVAYTDFLTWLSEAEKPLLI